MGTAQSYNISISVLAKLYINTQYFYYLTATSVISGVIYFRSTIRCHLIIKLSSLSTVKLSPNDSIYDIYYINAYLYIINIRSDL